MDITRVGLDIAKNLFQVHGINQHGKVLLQKQISRDKMLAFFANMPSCLIGMEACSGAHYWARELTRFGHEVKLMAAQFVSPYRKRTDKKSRWAEGLKTRRGYNIAAVALAAKHARMIWVMLAKGESYRMPV